MPFNIQVTPTTGVVPLTASYNISIPTDTPLSNFVMNYGDGNTYYGITTTVATQLVTIPTQHASSYQSIFIQSYRNVIPSASILESSSHFKIKLSGPSSGVLTILHASIVERDGSTQNGTTTPTQITFNNGQSSVAIAQGAYAISDDTIYNINSSKSYLIILDIGNATSSEYTTLKSSTFGQYYTGNGETWNLQNASLPTGYGEIVCISELFYDETTYGPQSSQTTTHIYTEPGTYTIWAEGYNEFATHVYYEIPYGVTVNAEAVVASFTTSQSYNTVTFTNTSTGNINECYWTFDDGQSSYEESPTHTYYSPATYNVTLYASNQYQYDTFATTVTITQVLTPPEVYFTPNNLNVISPTLPYTVNFTNLSTPAFGCTYNWLIDGTSYTTQNASHSFATYGMYDVGLTVTNALGSATKTYNDAIRITRKGKTFYEVINYADTPATFHVEVFNEVATSADTIIQAHIFDESINFVQDEVPDEPGLDEWGMRHFYSSINEWGHRIISAVTDWGNRILYNGSTLDNSPITLFKAQEFREDVVFIDEWQFGTT